VCARNTNILQKLATAVKPHNLTMTHFFEMALIVRCVPEIVYVSSDVLVRWWQKSRCLRATRAQTPKNH
jgi:hypothetical protein